MIKQGILSGKGLSVAPISVPIYQNSTSAFFAPGLLESSLNEPVPMGIPLTGPRMTGPVWRPFAPMRFGVT